MIIDTLTNGGKERRLVELLKGLSKHQKIETAVVILSDDIYFKQIYELNVIIHILKRKTRRDISIFWKLYSICKRFNPAVIQSWELMSSIYAIPVAKLLGVKFINACITETPNRYNPIPRKNWLRYRLTFQCSDIIVGNSIAGIKAFQTPVGRSYCIYNGFDFKRIQHLEKPASIRERFKIKTDLVIGMVAAFNPRKDYETFLMTARLVLDYRKDVTFMAVGDGDLFDSMKKLVKEDHEDHIIFTGLQNNIESIVNIFTIGVLATYSEGISNSVLEYMALGKPVIATRDGGTSEIVEDGISGYLVPPKDNISLYNKIKLLLNDPQLAEKMGKAGREIIHSKFNLDKMVREFIGLYKCQTK